MKILQDVEGIENKTILMLNFFEQPQQVWECDNIEEGKEAYNEFNEKILKYGTYFNISSITLICKNNLIAHKMKMLDKWIIIKEA